MARIYFVHRDPNIQIDGIAMVAIKVNGVTADQQIANLGPVQQLQEVFEIGVEVFHCHNQRRVVE
jgi:hypothetical protein